MTDVLMALAMLAAFALIGTGVWMLVKRRGTRLKAGLMIAAGLVTIFNVWVNAVPIG
jgi:multisubunit Na+/H+ antiporter MnhC subunit